MMSANFNNIQTWEEFASSLPKNAADTDKLMAAVCYLFEVENSDTADIKTITSNYFRRARWSRPVNLSATANYCASKGWLSEIGRSNSQKQWKITKRGYETIKARMPKL
jgi:hypothetical protein